MNGPELVERLIAARDRIRQPGYGEGYAREAMADAANYITDYINGAKASQDALANALADEREDTIRLRKLVAELLRHSLAHYGNVADQSTGIGLVQFEARLETRDLMEPV